MEFLWFLVFFLQFWGFLKTLVEGDGEDDGEEGSGIDFGRNPKFKRKDF